MGRVEISTEPAFFSYDRRISVEFSNIRNVTTGASVTLSHMRWTFTGLPGVSHHNGGILSRPAGYMELEFSAPNNEEVFGVFDTIEAIGAFGAKKQ